MCFWKEFSVKSALRLFDVSSLIFWKINEVDGSLVCHDGQSVVLGVKSNGLEFLIHLDLGQAEIAVPVLVQYLHEPKPISKFKSIMTLHIMDTYPDLAFAASVFLLRSPLEKPNCLV